MRLARTNRLALAFATFSLLLFAAAPTNAQRQISSISFEHQAFTVAVNPATNRVYVPQGLFFDASIGVVEGDPASPSFNQNIGRIDLPDDSTPGKIAVNPVTNRIYVTDYQAGKILIADGATNSFIKSVAVGPHPVSVAINSATNRIYVPTELNVTVLDGNTDAVIANVPLADSNHFGYRVAVNTTTNRVYVTSLQGTITVIDGANNSLITTIAGGSLPSGVAANPVTDRVYVGNMGDGTLSIIPGATNTIEKNIFFGPYAVSEAAVNSVTGRVYVSQMDISLSVVDGRVTSPTYNAVLSTLSYPNRILDLAMNPSTNLIYGMTGSMLVVFDDPPRPPADAISALIAWVASLNLAQGTTNSLDSKLTNAQNALQSVKGGDAATACNKLNSFINEAQAQVAKQQLTVTQVRELTVEAGLIRSSLGCQ